jgi:anti-sigma B factor antagonist
MSAPEIVEVAGEADRATSQRLRDTLAAIGDRPDARVLVDLTFATFVDSSTLGVLAVSSKRFGPRRDRFAIVCPAGEVRMMFELTALDRVMPLYATRAEALAAIAAAGAAPGAPSEATP